MRKLSKGYYSAAFETDAKLKDSISSYYSIRHEYLAHFASLPNFISYLWIVGFYSRRNFLKSGSLLGASALIFPQMDIKPIDFCESPSIIKPKKLKKGNIIGVTAPGGVILNPKDILKFEKLLQKMGYSVVLGDTLKKKYGYLAGKDEVRANELMSFFEDPKIDGIIAMRGGWGCARLLDKLDYSIIQKYPKVLMGFSDVTSLLNAIHIKTGLVTFHGLVGINNWNAFSTEIFNRVVCNGENCAFPLEKSSSRNFVSIVKGKARGKLFGGNLSVISGLVGSPFFKLPENTILFLEETNEEPYVVDRLLTHLKLANVYERLSGIIFGHCSNCIAQSPENSLPILKIIKEHFSALTIPVSFGSPIGHISNKWTIPIGIEAEMDSESGLLVLLEPAVS